MQVVRRTPAGLLAAWGHQKLMRFFVYDTAFGLLWVSLLEIQIS
jgi:hypothetical protein